MKYEGNKSRPIAFNLGTGHEDGALWGDFYNGSRTSVNTELIFKTSKYYALSADVKYNNISIGSKKFETKEFGGRLLVDFSTRLTTSTFLQWNNETKEVNMNFRLHYIPKIGSDVYVVYNHLYDEEANFKTLYNTGMFKVDYNYRF